jgi:DNA-nicking Smr family endonuclease
MIHYLSNQKVEVDIHSMGYTDAKRFLQRFLTTVNGSVREVTVIHGYSSGTVLRDMVRNDLKHHRIRSKVLSLNPGITILYLK